jgi:hypothetical protein
MSSLPTDNPPPVVTGTQYRLGTPAELCSWGLRPHLVTGFLVQYLRQHFADRQNIEDPALRGPAGNPRYDYIWQAGNLDGLAIESITRWVPDLAQKGSRLIVKRNAWQTLQMGINDEKQGWLNPDGSQQFEFFYRGSHTVFCISQDAAEAELLGAEVYRELRDFGPFIRASLQLKKWNLAEVDTLYKMEEASGGGYAVPVTVAYAASDGVSIRQHAPRLKKISLRDMAP